MRLSRRQIPTRVPFARISRARMCVQLASHFFLPSLRCGAAAMDSVDPGFSRASRLFDRDQRPEKDEATRSLKTHQTVSSSASRIRSVPVRGVFKVRPLLSNFCGEMIRRRPFTRIGAH